MLFVLSFRGDALEVTGCAGPAAGAFLMAGDLPARPADTVWFVDNAGLLVAGMYLLGGMVVVVMGYPGAALELVIRLRPALETPVAARVGVPPGEFVDVLPTTAPGGAPPGRPVARDPITALEGAPPGRPLAGDPMMALEGAPPGRPITGIPVMELEETPTGWPFVRDPIRPLEGAPPGRPAVRDPVMALDATPPERPFVDDPMIALEGAPPGTPVMGNAIMALEGAPPGTPVAGKPMMALEEAPAGGCALTGPPGKALVWARRPVAVAASQPKAASRISPTRPGYNLPLKNGFALFMEGI